jgi:MFS family permease
MAAFGSFWTAIALRLAASPFHLDQSGIALFALAGAGGAVVAPIAGRAGDRGLTVLATRIAHATTVGALVLSGVAGAGWFGFEPARHHGLALALLCLAAFVLDIGVIGDQTLGRRAINMLHPEARGRINGLFTGIFFVGSATGSALSGFAWATSGWSMVCLCGLVFAGAALLLGLRDRRASTKKSLLLAETNC